MRLPREWLGPPEELVPIVPVGDSPAAEDDLEAILSASAFWSEDSASLQDVVQAPAVVQAQPVAQAPPVAQPLEPSSTRRRPHSLRWAILAAGVGAMLVAAVIGSVEAPAGGRTRTAARVRTPKAAATALIPSRTRADAHTGARDRGLQRHHRVGHRARERRVNRAALVSKPHTSHPARSHSTPTAGSAAVSATQPASTGAQPLTTASAGSSPGTAGTSSTGGSEPTTPVSVRSTGSTPDQSSSSDSTDIGLPAPGGPPPP